MSKLRQMRIKRKMTLVDAAKQMNMSFQLLAYHEKRGVTKTSLAGKFASFYGCSPLELLDWPKKERLSR